MDMLPFHQQIFLDMLPFHQQNIYQLFVKYINDWHIIAFMDMLPFHQQIFFGYIAHSPKK